MQRDRDEAHYRTHHVSRMGQPSVPVSSSVGRSETLLLGVTEDGTMKIGLPPKHRQDDYRARAAVIGELQLVCTRHVISSPEGELFVVRNGDLYRGPLPAKKGADWFSTARSVGKSEWVKFQILFFHPGGELYGITRAGELYKGPPPTNENLPWMHGQATKIWGVYTNDDEVRPTTPGVFYFNRSNMLGLLTRGRPQCKALFFDPRGNLYAIDRENKLLKGAPPATGHTFNEWKRRSAVIGQGGWLENLRFVSFGPDGNLWGVERETGNLYRGAASGDGRSVDAAERVGCYYDQFQFLCFTKDKTISNIMSFQFLPDRGQRVSESPEVIEERIYDNRRSSVALKHNFSFDKTVKESSSFSHEHGFTFEVGNVFTVKAGIPAITSEIEATVQMNRNTSRNWSFTKTNETEVRFSSSSDVEVPPGRAIRLVASVVKAVLVVPYKAKVRTLFGFETEIEGTWNGATHYNLMVVQEDYRR